MEPDRQVRPRKSPSDQRPGLGLTCRWSGAHNQIAMRRLPVAQALLDAAGTAVQLTAATSACYFAMLGTVSENSYAAN